MTYFLLAGEWIHACEMWRKGCDTKTIAEYFNCPETLIWKELPVHRAKYSRLREVAA